MKRILIILCSSAILMATGIFLSASSPQAPSIGSWSQTGNLSGPRAGASATTLQDGRVLVTGGDPGDGTGPQATADIINTDGTISPAPSMNNARSQHVSVTLQDGRVLVAGGVTTNGSTTATPTAEIFDPVANSWTSAGLGMMEARSGATAGLLPDGRVVVVGGQNGSAISSTIEIFDPVAGAFSYAAAAMPAPRTQYAMAVLQDGRVLIVGGFDGTVALGSSYIFDPVAGTVNQGPSLAVARFGHSATTLLNGQILVVGGNNGSTTPGAADLASAEIFDPTAGTFTTVQATLGTPREGHLAFLLPNNNNVLIIGGTSAGAALASSEVFSPWQGTFAPTSNPTGTVTTMAAARSSATGAPNQVNAPSSVAQRNGVLLVAGGNDANGNALNSVESYGFATVQTDQRDYPPGTTVSISGSGWQPGETVTLTLVESPFFDTHGPFPVLADANGNISDSSFITDAHDANVKFTLTAVGSVSQAQMTFTDSTKPSSNITFPAQSGSYNAAGWTGTITGTATFANGTTGRAVNVSVERNGTTMYWNGTGFTSSTQVFLPASGTTSWTFSFPSSKFPADDSYTVQSQATDSNGTETGKTTATFTIDNTAPAAPSKPTLAPGSDSGSSQSDGITNAITNLKFNGTAEANSTVNLYVDGSATSSGTGTANNAGSWNNINVAGPLSESTHTIKATATDAAGNVSQLSAALTITIDTTPPTATITSNPTNPTTSTSATFSFTGTDPTSGGVSSGVDHFLCKLDAAAFATCTSPDTLTGLTAGSHTFQVEAVDVAGNTGTPASYTWTVVTQFGVTFNAVDTSNNALSGTGNATIVTYTGTQGGTVHSNVALTASGLGSPILFDAGTAVTYTYSSPVSGGTGKQYVLTSTSPASITNLSAATTVIGAYQIQYQVTFDASSNVKGDSTATIVTVGGSGKAASALPFSEFVDGSSSVTYSYASPIASTAAPTTTQYRWASTSGLSQTLQTNTFMVSGPGTVTATYQIQYQVTFDASSNVKGDSTATIVTVGGSGKAASALPFSEFVDGSSSVTYSYASPIASTAAPTTTQYRWASTSGLSQTLQTNTFMVSGPGTVTATYQIQYQVTFDASSNVKGDSTATIVTVGGSGKAASALPFSEFVDGSSSVTYSYASPIASTAAPTTTQYRWASTSGLSQTLQTNTFMVSGPGTVTATYQIQYQVTFDASSNVKGDSTATIVTVGGSGKAASALPFSEFVDGSSSVTYSYASPIASTAAPTTTQYRWASTSGLSQTLQTNTFMVSGPGTVTATYQIQYQVTFDASSNVKGDSTATIVTVGGSGKAASALPFSEFVDGSSSVTYSYASPIASTAAPTTTQYRWASTSGLSQTLQTNTFMVSGPGTVTATYQIQYQVTFDASSNVKGDSTATIVTVGGSGKAASALPFSEFVDGSSSVTYSYASPVASTAAPTTTQYRWDTTSGLSQTLQTNTFTVSGPGTVTGNYVTQYKVSFDASANVKGDSTATIVTVAGSPETASALPFTTGFLDSGSSLMYSYASPVASTGAPTTTQYRWNTTSGLSQTLQTNTFTVSGPGTVTGNYVTQYKVSFDASANVKGDSTATIVTVAGSPETASALPFTTGFLDSGSSLMYSYASPVASTGAPTTTQYRWNTTSGLSQTLQTNTFTVSGPGTVTGNYVTQYKVSFDASANVKGDSTATIVTVAGSPETAGALPFTTGFLDSGSSLMYSYASPVASTGAPTTTQYRWNTTSGLSQTLQTNTFTVSGPGTVTGNYVTQYKVSFDASANVKGDSTATIVTVAGSPETASALPFSEFVDNGGSIMYSYASPVASAAAPMTTQYRWNTTSGLGQTLQTNTFTVSAPGTVTGNYVTQYQVTFDASPNVRGDSTATIVTVAGSPETASALPFSEFVDSGSSVTYSYASPVASAAAPMTTQYRWNTTSGLGQTLQTNTFTVSGAGTVTGNYVTQYKVSFDASSNVKGDSTATIVTVAGSPETASALPFSQFEDSGSSVMYSYSSPVASAAAPTTTQYRWDTTSGLSQTLQTNTFTVSGPGTVTGNYVTQYKVSFDASANVKGDSTATIVTVAGSPETASALPFTTGFLDSGSSLMYSYASPVASTGAPTTTQYRWNTTSGLSQTLQTNTFTVSGPGTVTGNYVTQYKVSFDASANVKGDSTATIVTVAGSPETASALPFTTGFLDSGSSLMYSYASPVASTGAPTTTQYRWNTTSGLSQTLQTNTFTVSGPGTVTGNYVTQYKVSFDASANVKGDSTATIVTVAGSPETASALPFTTGFLDSGSSLMYSYASPVASTGAPTTTQYRWNTTSGLSQTLQTNTFTVSGPGTVTGNYVTQYKVSFDASANVKGDSTATIVTVAGSPETASALPFSEFVDNGGSIMYSYASPVASAAAPMTTQYRWNTTSGLGQTLQTNTFTASAPGTVTGTYLTQYKITITASGLPIGVSSDSTGTVVTYSGTQGGVAVGPIYKNAASLGYSAYFDSGTTLNATYTTPINSTTAGKGYVLGSITGGTAALPSTSLTVSGAATITGTYNVWALTWDAGSVFTAHYSDVTGLKADLTENGSPISNKSIAFCVYSGTCGAGSDSGSALTTASGVATDTTDLHQAAGGYTASASCSLATCGVALSITDPYTIVQRSAFIMYSGGTVGQINFGLTLQATVWDGAAVGYPGTSPEPSGTIGDITKMWIEFNIYPALSCGSGTPVASPIAQVANSPGSGIGTATTTYMSTTEASYCVIARLVNSSGSTNLYYTAPNAQTATIAFYQDAGEFATGGGWIVDPTGSHGNFGFNARYGKKGTPTGQMVYVWRAMYNGVMADWIIKSTSQNLTALSFTQTGGTYPNSALVQGGCVLQIIQESNGAAIGGQGNLTFTMEATDSGKSSGIGVDNYALTVLNGNTVIKSVSSTSLSGGNIVIHMQ